MIHSCALLCPDFSHWEIIKSALSGASLYRSFRLLPTLFWTNLSGSSFRFVKKIIAGPSGVFICDECVGLCQDIIEEEVYDEEEVSEQVEMPTPAEIKKILDEYVIEIGRAHV